MFQGERRAGTKGRGSVQGMKDRGVSGVGVSVHSGLEGMLGREAEAVLFLAISTGQYWLFWANFQGLECWVGL